jgi:small subunit ribosomal protein S4
MNLKTFNEKKKKELKDYGLKLAAKQLMRGAYNNLSERSLKKQFDIALTESARGQAKAASASVGEKLVGLLERRLEVVLTKMGGAVSLGHARQLIAHGKVQVNGQRKKERGYKVKSGDSVSWGH